MSLLQKCVYFLAVLLSAKLALAVCSADDIERSNNNTEPAEVETVTLAEGKILRIFFPKTYLNHELTRAYLSKKDKDDKRQTINLKVTLIDDRYQTTVEGDIESYSFFFARYGDCFSIGRPLNKQNKTFKYAPPENRLDQTQLLCAL